MNKQEAFFKEYLRKKGLRFTPERSVILKAIVSINGHFDVESLFERLKANDERISMATIYRSIPLFLNSGIIKESIRSDDRIHYERAFGRDHHDHLICIKCGAIIEFKDDRIEELQELVCKKYNFKPVEHKLGIHGYCKNCLNKK
jgi:Fur family ferric uptake transcriptional regulator